MNIVFSTTRQWNPGDEFILMGTINLLNEHFTIKERDGFNPIIYNRNPQTRRARKRDIIKMIDNFLGKDFIEKFKDNSVKDRKPLDYADLVVFAGSPEWVGRRLKKLYSEIINYKIPTIFLGIGTGSDKPLVYRDAVNQMEARVFENFTKLATARDEYAFNAIKHFDFARLLPCPALFASKTHRKVQNVKKIGLIYSTVNSEGGNNVSSETHKFILDFYKKLLKEQGDKYEFEFIAHYIDELSEFKKDFPNETMRYSYDSKDYLDIYAKYDFVIGCRVHGVGISASLGIPGLMISHDERCKAAKGFLSDSISIEILIDEAIKIVNENVKNIEEKSKAVIEHKEKTKQEYMELFDKHISDLFI
ncbi:MAG: polysaccharide pyruvyl transferase family protein [Campylobacteraceae bacterium]|nr:polysaccharide pyruvyl transferase family protein [Campylobacteraceae bacterium]